MLCRRAQVAELVDALGSGPSTGNGVEVRVFSWAPLFLSCRHKSCICPTLAGIVRLAAYHAKYLRAYTA